MKTFSMKPGSERYKHITCPLCGCERSRRFWNCGDFAFRRCPVCSLVYQNPQPVQEDLELRYDQEYFDYEIANEESFFRLMELGLGDIDFDAVASATRSMHHSFLDIGCATGMLLASMASKGWSVQGVEICEPAARFGTDVRQVPIHIGTLETAPFADGLFSVVHCSHLIEHLTDPRTFVGEVARILEDDGLFVVTTPNIAGFQARLFRSEWRSAIADHMVLYSRKTLRKLLELHGFDVLAVSTWGGLAAGTAPAPVKKVFDRLAKTLGFGDVMIILARRRADDGRG